MASVAKPKSCDFFPPLSSAHFPTVLQAEYFQPAGGAEPASKQGETPRTPI